jgi:hypothetical protein
MQPIHLEIASTLELQCLQVKSAVHLTAHASSLSGDRMPLALRTPFSENGHAEISVLTSFHHRIDELLYEVGSCMTYTMVFDFIGL